MTRFARDPVYRRRRFPAKVISYAVWLYLRFPLSLRMVEDLLAALGIIVSHQTVRPRCRQKSKASQVWNRESSHTANPPLNALALSP